MDQKKAKMEEAVAKGEKKNVKKAKKRKKTEKGWESKIITRKKNKDAGLFSAAA